MSAADRKPSGPRSIGKTRLILLTALAALVILCFSYSWLSPSLHIKPGNLAQQIQSVCKQQAKQKTITLTPLQINSSPIVNTQPWQTVQALVATIATRKEAKFARRAQQLTDHEVDQAFDSAFRCAELKKSGYNISRLPCPLRMTQPPDAKLATQAKQLSQRVQQLQRDIAQDHSDIARYKSKITTNNASEDTATNSESLSNGLQLARFQLAIDSDELLDVQHDLNRANGNFSVLIENEFDDYQISTRKFDSDQATGAPLPLHRVSNFATLIGRVHIWIRQSNRLADLRQALHQTEVKICALAAQNKLLHSSLPSATSTPALSQTPQQRNLSRLVFINNDRYVTNTKLAQVYNDWLAQERILHNRIQTRLLQSIGAIFAIILWMVILDTILLRLTGRPTQNRRKMQTLRAIFKVGIQIIGILIILLLIFGPPDQTGTIIGLITAALALALQDYILAFFGWFMLAGRNGISVGDMVEIDGICGEVVDIGLIRTTLLETTGLREKGEPTGRRVSLLNSYAVHGACFKFPSEGQWLWDEITITVPADADVYTIAKSVEKLATEETAESARLAELDWNRNMPSTSLNRVSARPIVMMWPSIALDVSTSIDIQVRYVTRAIGRYEVRDRLYRHVLQLLKDQGHQNPPQQANPSPA